MLWFKPIGMQSSCQAFPILQTSSLKPTFNYTHKHHLASYITSFQQLTFQGQVTKSVEGQNIAWHDIMAYMNG